jgi:Ca2+/H+ antiporter
LAVLSLFPAKGFLGTGATFGADINLVVQLIMGLALVTGALLAKHKRYRAHGVCQTTVLLLNLLMIGLVM